MFVWLWLLANIAMVVFIVMTIKEKDPETKKKKRKGWIISLVVAIIMFIAIGVSGSKDISSDKEKEIATEEETTEEEIIKEEVSVEESSEAVPDDIEPSVTEETKEELQSEEVVEETQETGPQEFVDKYKTDFIVGASLTLDRFISDYKMSLAPQLWTIAKFDDTDTLIGYTDITYNGEKGKFYFVGTLNFKDGKVEGVTPHYVYVINRVLGDDGYCDDVFDKISAIGQ